MIFDIREDNREKLFEIINRERLNRPLLLFLTFVIIITSSASGYYLILRRPKKKAHSLPQVLKLAEFEVITNSTNSTSHTKSEKATQKKPPKELVYIVHSKDPEVEKELKKLCKRTELQPVKDRYTRIIAGTFTNDKEARDFIKRLKSTIPHLSPWLLRSDGKVLVIAGSYRDPARINSIRKVLKEKGIKTSTSYVEIIRGYNIKCTVDNRREDELLLFTKRLNLKIEIESPKSDD